MSKFFLITKREFLTQVKKKSFIILTLLAPIMIIAFGTVIGLMFKTNKSHSIIEEVVDKSGLFTNNQLKSNEQLNYVFVSAINEKSKINNLKGNQSLDGILILPKLKNQNVDTLLNKETRVIINRKIGFDTQQKIVSNISNVIRKEKIKQLGIQKALINDSDQNFVLKTINITDNKEDSDLVFSIKSLLSIVLMYMTFIFIIIYGVRVMRSVLEEKNNRVVEIIISSVKPFELMMGKIIGVTMVAITQFLIWIIISVISAVVLNTKFYPLQKNISSGRHEKIIRKLDLEHLAIQVSHSLLELNWPLIIFVFIVFFLLGYIFYSSIYAAIGSAMDNETETQQFTLFAILPLTLGMYGSFTLINNPDGPLGFWLSIIPFTSPVTMIARIPFGVPVWQITLSITLLLASTTFMIFLAGKIYRVGILMYGNTVTLKDLWKIIKG